MLCGIAYAEPSFYSGSYMARVAPQLLSRFTQCNKLLFNYYLEPKKFTRKIFSKPISKSKGGVPCERLWGRAELKK